MSKTSKYNGVCYFPRKSGVAGEIARGTLRPWLASVTVNYIRREKRFATEREAAIQYDKWVIEEGFDRPLNILKPKKQ